MPQKSVRSFNSSIMFRSIVDGGAKFGLYLEVEPGILGVEFLGVSLLGATIDCYGRSVNPEVPV